MPPIAQEVTVLARDRLLCAGCVEDDFLRAEIDSNGSDGKCSYCGLEGRTFSIDRIADLTEAAFSEHFCRVTREPALDPDIQLEATDDAAIDRAGPSTPGYPVTEVIRQSAGIDETVAEDIRRVLEERHSESEHDSSAVSGGPFDSAALYVRDTPFGLEDEAGWLAFDYGLKSEVRFFNREAETFLASIFRGIDCHRTAGGRPILVSAGPGKEISMLYRARVFQSETELREAINRPERDVGSPPPEKAVAGRMNGAGISVFYGATDADLALGEVQPPVGSKVLIGHFEILQPLILLDLKALERVVDERGSIFDSSYGRRLGRAEFLRVSATVSQSQ